jgi:hypothetical protein
MKGLRVAFCQQAQNSAVHLKTTKDLTQPHAFCSLNVRVLTSLSSQKHIIKLLREPLKETVL